MPYEAIQIEALRLIREMTNNVERHNDGELWVSPFTEAERAEAQSLMDKYRCAT